MPKRGTVREDGLVYIRKRNGKEIWGSPEQWENSKQWHLKYNDKCMNLHRKKNKKWKIGEYNPENEMYFIRSSGNYNNIWGTLEEVQKLRDKKRQMKLAYKARMIEVKKENLKNAPIKRKRGDIDPVLNLYFFKLNSLTGVEIWYSKEKFQKYINKEKETRNKRNKLKNNA
jgi:hypothetical protein